MKSEFPQSNYEKIAKKLTWLFSPILFFSLLIFSFFSAQGLKIDISKGLIEKIGYIHLKETKEYPVRIDQKVIGRTNQVLQSNKVSENESAIKVQIDSDDGRIWTKTVKLKEDKVSIFYPILYPKELDFGDYMINASEIYSSPNNSTFFYYQKILDDKVYLFRYQTINQLFNISVSDSQIADITKYIVPDTFVAISGQKLTLANLYPHRVLPSNQGLYAFIAIQNIAAIIVGQDGKVTNIPNIIPTEYDQYAWINEDQVIIKNQNQIFLFEINSKKLTSLYSSNSSNEQLEIQFINSNKIFIKSYTPENIDILTLSIDGKEQSILEIPNIDKLRVNNISKIYDMLTSHNLIVIQSGTNIYSLNIINYEFNKLNKFSDEKIVALNDADGVIITVNNANKNQFRYYNLDTYESSSFIVNEIDREALFSSVTLLNYSQTIVFSYPDKLVFTDTDGNNTKAVLGNGNDMRGLIFVKENTNLLFAIYENDNEDTQNTYKIRVDRFEN